MSGSDSETSSSAPPSSSDSDDFGDGDLRTDYEVNEAVLILHGDFRYLGKVGFGFVTHSWRGLDLDVFRPVTAAGVVVSFFLFSA